MPDSKNPLVVSLTDTTISSTEEVSPSNVGGKASSLAKLFSTEGLSRKVPKAYALSVSFFQLWIDEMKQKTEFKSLLTCINNDSKEEEEEEAMELCKKLQEISRNTVFLTKEQASTIQMLVDEMNSDDNWNAPKLAAVRSSAPEEDGSGASFAGAFETKLGVPPNYDALLQAVHDCFASLWDYRVLDYKIKNSTKALDDIGFALVVMEMIDSNIAGVAFSANPLNSDRDELVVDSSWGLGESVVDGSVTADRYVVNKIDCTIVKETLGIKGIEKRLGPNGGVVETTIDEGDSRRTGSTLNKHQLIELTKLVSLVEKTYGMPMDVEWAVLYHDNVPNDNWELKLLQARPITTLYTLDEFMMTEPGRKRKLYFDHNILAAATTTNPFTTLDKEFMSKFINWIFGIPFEEMKLIGDSSDSFRFNSSTRQYLTFSYAFKLKSPKEIAEKVNVMDSYVSSIFSSKDCDRAKYTADSLPSGWFRFIIDKIPLIYKMMFTLGAKYKENPKQMKELNKKIVEEDMARLEEHKKKRMEIINNNNTSDVYLQEYIENICSSIRPSLKEEVECNFGVVAPTMNHLNIKRNDQSLSKEIRDEYEDLCSGYIGDELMEINIAMYELANALDESIWKQYDDDGDDGLSRMLEAIRKNELPNKFVSLWVSFLDQYGFDGQDQLFVSCPRYQDRPELLLKQLKMNALGHVKDPAITQEEQVSKRHAVMAKHEKEAATTAAAAINEAADASWLSRLSSFLNRGCTTEQAPHFGSLDDVKKRNEILEHLMWIRNAPKIHLTKVVGTIRTEVLRIEEKLLKDGRLNEKGDIFHLTVKEIDDAISNNNTSVNTVVDLMEIIRPRKAVYERALRSTECPILVDSRCRILRPDPPTFADGEEPPPGTLIGSAMAPGIATGKVRIINNPSEKFENGEVLCAVVTGPAWTPMFACASAVVLQVGGVLQHGALCAREYGKPAVSNIDIHTLLKDGIKVSVDGNTGIVKILDDDGSDK